MPASALCALITTDCRAPCVANDKLAETLEKSKQVDIEIEEKRRQKERP